METERSKHPLKHAGKECERERGEERERQKYLQTNTVRHKNIQKQTKGQVNILSATKMQKRERQKHIQTHRVRYMNTQIRTQRKPNNRSSKQTQRAREGQKHL